MFRCHVLLCGGTGCTSAGSREIKKCLEKELKERGLDKEIAVVKTGCFGMCSVGPIMMVYPDQVLYCTVQPEDVPEIVPVAAFSVRPAGKPLALHVMLLPVASSVVV